MKTVRPKKAEAVQPKVRKAVELPNNLLQAEAAVAAEKMQERLAELKK